jgi:hypothetical protein
MFLVSFLLSVGDVDVERSDGRIAYFDSRTLQNHAGTDISPVILFCWQFVLLFVLQS